MAKAVITNRSETRPQYSARFLYFIILALATFRIGYLIADEDGPFGLLDKMRQVIGVKRDQMGENFGTNNFATGVICVWCNSIWIAAGLTGVYMYDKGLVVLVCLPFALSAVALVIAEIVKMIMAIRINNG